MNNPLPPEMLDRAGNPLPSIECPTCHYKMDSASHPEKPAARPKPGDITVCLGCGEVLVFTEAMTAREPLLAELLALDPEASALLTKLQRIIRAQRSSVTRK